MARLYRHLGGLPRKGENLLPVVAQPEGEWKNGRAGRSAWCYPGVPTRSPNPLAQ